MKTRYKVKLFNDFVEPFWKSDSKEDTPIVEHKTVDEYATYDYGAFKSALDDFLDAPKKALTEKDVRQDFETNRSSSLPISKVEAIKAYYNGRLALKSRIYGDLAKIDNEGTENRFPITLKYAIPFELNYFSCEEDDPCDKLTKMNDAYIEIEMSKDSD